MSQDTPGRNGHASDAGQSQEPPPDLGAALEAVQRSAFELLSGFHRPPTALRIRAGGLTVEAEWAVPYAEPAPGPAAVAGYAGAVAGPATVAGQAAHGAHGAHAGDGTSDGHEAGTRHCYLRAPTVGVFYRAPEPGAKPFVAEGDVVTLGQQVGIVEAMKLMIPVHADIHGTIVEVLAENGASVEYDERLFAVTPLADT